MLGKAQMDGAEPAPQQPQGEGGQSANPEEQAAFEAYVKAAMEVIMADDANEPDPVVLANLQGQYTEQTLQRFQKADPPLRSLQEAPIDPLAAATVDVLLQIEDIAAQAGAELQDDIVYHGGSHIMEILADIAEQDGIHDYDEANLETAFYRAVDLYRVSSSRVDQANLGKEFGAFLEADKAGQFQGGGAPAPAEQGA